MARIPKRLGCIAALLFPVVGLCYFCGLRWFFESMGWSWPTLSDCELRYYLIALSDIALMCFFAWSLLRFRAFGRWMAIVVSCIVVFGLCSPVEGSRIYGAGEMMVNRILFGIPFVYIVYYLFSPAFRRIYSEAYEERRQLLDRQK